MHSLPIFVRLDSRKVILLGAGDTRAAKARLLERAGAIIVGEDEDAALAIVAIDDLEQAEATVARLKARGILVNAVDRPVLCDFTLPAIVDRDPVLIAIGTGGASAGLAKVLRQRLETLLPPSLGELARGLHAARDRMRALWPDPAARRHAIDAALDGPLDPFTMPAPDAVEKWLATPGSGSGDTLVTIHVHSADPDDLTLRQARLLGQADTLFHTPGIAPAILERARADAVRVLVSEVPRALPPGLSLHLVDEIAR